MTCDRLFDDFTLLFLMSWFFLDFCPAFLTIFNIYYSFYLDELLSHW